MCIEVRVTYPRCFHVHLGHELCNDFKSDYGYCPRFEAQRRIDPFCPSCSKVDYQAHRAQYARGLNTQQHHEAMIQTWTATHPHSRHISAQPQPQPQPQTQPQPTLANKSKRPSLESIASDSSSYSETRSLSLYHSPPSPIEPPIDPGLMGPRHFPAYQQRLAGVVGTGYRPRLGHQDDSRA